MQVSGSCQCGQIRYAVEGEPLMTYACHCSDCQKRTGSAFSLGAIYPVAAISLEGELATWERVSDDGLTNTRYSCKACGNIIYGIGEATPDLLKLQPGTLDDTSNVGPDAHIWTRSAQAWFQLPADSLAYETQPEQLIDVYTAVMERRAQ
jgi:hypothetical protein